MHWLRCVLRQQYLLLHCSPPSQCSDTYGASCTSCGIYECKNCGGQIADHCKSYISDIKCTCDVCEDNYEKCSGRCADLTSDPSNW